ncbi:hypothetical protein CCR75_006593 [Bremia lactucae]|uniref:Cleavage and polyadenylation specificity factor subunit 1 n=1 Tax=Bremia lactucae TaxID=4779 RepID=A0A976IGZ7_BRELC|nr:hypothetical protein CCR75_006593 [Bremia lactucae]
MGQHFLFHRDLVAATAVHHAVNARLSSDLQADLVLVGPQWLRIYRIEPCLRQFTTLESSKNHVLHLLASFPLAGVAHSLHVLHYNRILYHPKHRFVTGPDVLLLSFPRFKWVLVGYDRRTFTLVTLAMYTFEEHAMGPGATLKGEPNGREQLLGLATQAAARVDPQTRCGAMLVYGDQLVIVPFKSESRELAFFEDDKELDDDACTTSDSEDDEDEKQLEELVHESHHKSTSLVPEMNANVHVLLDQSVKMGVKRKRHHRSGLLANTLTGREFLLRLRELELTSKIVDFAFLHGYLEPTLMVLHEENEKNATSGRMAAGYDTFCLTVLSINLHTHLHPKIWTVKNLPSDSFRIIPCRAPLGGVVVLAANAILYFNQTQFYGLATNAFALKTVNLSVFPLSEAVYETLEHDIQPLDVVLYDCQYEYVGEKELVLTVPSGAVYMLSLPSEDVSRRGFYGAGGVGGSRPGVLSLRLLHARVLAQCVSVHSETQTLFLGSRSGDSILFAMEKKQVKDYGDSECTNEKELNVEKGLELEARMDGKIEGNIEDEEDEEDLFLYGTTRVKEEEDCTNARDTIHDVGRKQEERKDAISLGVGYTYDLRPIDLLPGIGPITSIDLGMENNADSSDKREELVISGGYDVSGAISILHNGLRPLVGTEAELSGCRAMWTVSSSLALEPTSTDGRRYNAYLILSVAHRTMVLRTGEGMEPLEDNSGFYTSGPTLAAANLFQHQRIVQIFKQGARVMMEVLDDDVLNNGDKTALDDNVRVKLVCTQEITLEGDVESGGMNVDTSKVGIVSVDVVDPYILLLLTDGSIRLLMGDEADLELTVIDPVIDFTTTCIHSNGNGDVSMHKSSAACLFYDWTGMFQEKTGEHECKQQVEPTRVKPLTTAERDDDELDALYQTRPATHPTFRNEFPSSPRSHSTRTHTDESISIPLLLQNEALMMCGLCFEDGSLHVYSLPDFQKRGVFPYLTFAPQSLVNTWTGTLAHESMESTAPVLGLHASTSLANDTRIQKAHAMNSPVADIVIHRVGPSEGQMNASYLARMVLLVFLANGDLLLYAATPTHDRLQSRSSSPIFQFIRINTELITRPFVPPKVRPSTHLNETSLETSTSAVVAKLRAGFRYPMLTKFYNVNTMSGCFFRGAHPMWILGNRGHPCFVRMCVPNAAIKSPLVANQTTTPPRVSVPVLSFTPFHHWNCPNGFIYFHSRGSLRVCELPSSKTSTILPSSGGFVLQKAEFGATLHHMLYLGNHGPGGVAEALVAPTYAVVCSLRMKPADAENATEVETVDDELETETLDANGNVLLGSNVMAPTTEMFSDLELSAFPHTEEDVYELRLVQTNEFREWDFRGVFRVHFERFEVVLCIRLMYLFDSSLLHDEVASTSVEWHRKKRPYLVLGTGWVGPHGEDESGRGRLLLYELDYAQYVNEEGGATSGKLPKLRLVFMKEHRQGAISAVAQLGPYVLAAVGSKLIVYEFKSEQLIGCAFYDAQMFIVTLNVVKDFILYGDVYKSVHFLQWRELQRQLLLLAKDYEPLTVSATEFSVFETKVALLAVDMDENLHVLQYLPQDIESRGGQRLLRVSDFHLGVQVASMFRKRVEMAGAGAYTRKAAVLSCYVNVLGTSEGGIMALVPVSERVFRRLYTLQNVMINTLQQNCALNPREFRMLKTNGQQRCGRGDAWSKKKWKKSFLDAMVLFQFLTLDYVAQKELARCIGTTSEVVIHNLLEVQHATSAFL